VSTPRTLVLPDRVRRVTVDTGRGPFAALEAMPGRGVCERRPALLVPGYTGSKEDFLAVLEPLAAAGRRVIAIDLRGQYETPGPTSHGAYAPDALASDVAAVAAAVTGQEDYGVHLLGHSFGGLIARQAVLARETAVSSLTLLGSGPGRLDGPRATALQAMLAQLAEAGPGQLAERVAQLWDTHLGPEATASGVPAPIAAFLRERMTRTSPDGLIAMGQYLLNCPDRTAALAELGNAPMLVVYGENDDAWAPEVQDRMAKQLGAQRVCIPAAAHSPAVEAPETTAATLNAFWKSVESGDRRRRPASQGPDASAEGAGSGAAARGAGTGPGGGPSGTSSDRPSQGRRGSATALPSGQ
jgi:pimeloyl-ACP methyl ester carboxylesterase